jgi:phasin
MMTASARTKSNTARASAAPFDVPVHEMPNFGLPNMEVPEAFRAMADNGAAHAKDVYEKAKVATEEASELLQDTYAVAAKCTTDYNLKVIEIARTNASRAFECVRELSSVKSPSEFIDLWTAQARKQFEMISAQNKELWALAQKVTTETAGPLTTGMSKAYNKAVSPRSIS